MKVPDDAIELAGVAQCFDLGWLGSTLHTLSRFQPFGCENSIMRTAGRLERLLLGLHSLL